MTEACLEGFVDNLAGPIGPINISSLSSVSETTRIETDAPFTFNELDMAIHSSKNTAAGLDGILNNHLKLLRSKHKCQLLTMFNSVCNSGIIPEEWMKYQIIAIPNKNK